MEIEKPANVVTVKFQWGKQKFDFELDRSDDLDTVKAKLYSLTYVPTDKQKILYQGKIIKENEQLQSAKIANGAQMMLMGAAEGKEIQMESLIPTAKFLEEMTPAERAKMLKEKTGAVEAYGLVNLGNTCYINSTIQVLAKIPELKKALEERKNAASMGPPTLLAKAMSNVFHTLETSGDTVKPFSFIQVSFGSTKTFMSVFPQFAERDKESGSFQQQDADECFQGILSTLEPAMNTPSGQNIIEQLFSFDVMYKTKNQETDEEEETVSFERLRRLPCMIDAEGAPINQIAEGITVGLEGTIEKTSSTLERSCIYKKTGRISTLPSYLIVQKIRFIWKGQDMGTMNKAQKAKILRGVTFPKILDVAPFCTPELQAEFKETRRLLKERDEEKVKQQEKEYEEFKKQFDKTPDVDTQKINKIWKEKKKEEELKQHEKDLWRDHAGNKPTGDYELMGVITHKGRSADSGHYLGWTQAHGDEWYRFDDDDVTKVKTEDILALRGGGDWHMAYYLVYRKLVTDHK